MINQWELSRNCQIARGDEFDSLFYPVLLGERETSLSWWLEEVQRHIYPTLSRFVIDILLFQLVL